MRIHCVKIKSMHSHASKPPTTVKPCFSTIKKLGKLRNTASRTMAFSATESISDEEFIGELDGFRERDRGYTPFEFIEFTNIPLKHEVSIWVDRPIADCYKIWENRLNWMQWFEMIDEVGFHEEEPSYISMYLWYRWATTPFLELYVTLGRTQAQENKYILEEPVEGFPLVAAVLFQEGQQGETTHGTTVTLRISYLLPKVLKEFAGQLAVYADVDTKLQKSMAKMRAFAEGVDIDELEEIRKDNEEQIRANFAEQRVLKAEIENARRERVNRWEAVAHEAAQHQSTNSIDLDVAQDDASKSESDVEETTQKVTRTRRSKPANAQSNPAVKTARGRKSATNADV